MIRAAEIKVGNKIVLHDGKTIVEVIDIETVDGPGQSPLVSLFWLYDGQRRYMAYRPDDEIEVRS